MRYLEFIFEDGSRDYIFNLRKDRTDAEITAYIEELLPECYGFENTRYRIVHDDELKEPM